MAALLRCTIAIPLAAVLHGCAASPTPPVASTEVGATTTLTVPGQSAAFLASPRFATNLEVEPGARYLIAVVNTDPDAATTEDFTLVATYAPVGSPIRAPTLTAGAPRSTTTRYKSSTAPSPRYELTSDAARRIASMRKLQQRHLA